MLTIGTKLFLREPGTPSARPGFGRRVAQVIVLRVPHSFALFANEWETIIRHFALVTGPHLSCTVHS